MTTQTKIICDLLGKLERKYLPDESICQTIIENNVHKQEELELIDALCRATITSLNFNDYRRAVKYLTLAANFCSQRL